MRLQPDIIVAKLSQSTKSGQSLLYEVVDPDHSSALRLNAAGKGTIATPTVTNASSDQSWKISNLFGTFRYSRSRYSILKKARLNCRRGVEEIRAEYCGPSWLVNRVWEMRAVKSSFGWIFCPRTYTIVPKNSPVFNFAHDNNVEGLQELFSKMEASPYDCDERHITPLIVSIIFYM